MPQMHQNVYNSTRSQPVGLSSTLFNATFRLENFRLFTMYHYLWFKGLGYYSQLLQCTKCINSLTVTLLIVLKNTSKTSCWIKIPKLQTLGNLLFIPSHYLEAVDNYNEEKVITTNKITHTTAINETAKMPLLKLFLYFSFRNNVYW